MKTRKVVLLAGLCLMLPAAMATITGCGQGDGDTRNAVRSQGIFVRQTDSLALSESESFFIGSPSAITLDGRGRIYVADAHSGSVLQFGRDGKPLRRFGRKGAGPGELRAPYGLLVLGDTTLVVSDAASQKIVFFDAEGGAFVREARRVGFVTSIDTLSAGGLLLGRLDMKAKTSAAFLAFGDSTPDAFGPVAAEYFESASLSSALPVIVAVNAGSGSTVLGSAGSGKLFRVKGRKVADSVFVPSRIRRGTPRNIAEIFDKAQSLEQKAVLTSNLVRAGAFFDEWVGLVHLDHTLQGAAVTARVFLSIVNITGGVACLDHEVQTKEHARPVVTIFGNVFVVLEQVVTEERRPITTVRFFAPDFGACKQATVALEHM